MNKEQYRLDKAAFSNTSLDDNSGDKEYWLSKAPEERFATIEYLRQLNLKGYDPVTSRLQRFFEVVKQI